MLFKAEYSIDKDIDNYLRSVWRFKRKAAGRLNFREELLSGFPSEFKKAIDEAKDEKEATAVVRSFLESRTKWFKNNTELITKGVEYILNERKEEIIGLLEKVYGKKFPFDEVNVYITTLGICPYDFNARWFMVNRGSSIEDCLRTTKHELNHFMFHYYFSGLENKIGENNFFALKEALAVLTNPEGNNKPAIKPLEEYIKTIAENSIEEIINSATKFLEENKISVE